jgi:hypothetical protein
LDGTADSSQSSGRHPKGGEMTSAEINIAIALSEAGMSKKKKKR